MIMMVTITCQLFEEKKKEVGLVKLNVDAAMHQKSPSCCMWGVFADHYDNFLLGFAHSIGYCNIELWGLLYGLKLAQSFSFSSWTLGCGVAS